MASMRNALGLIAALAATTPALAQQGEGSGPLIRAGATEAISDHVYVILDESVPGVPNVGVIVGSDAALVVDTGMGERNGATVLAEAQEVAPGRDLYIVSTHYHPEHDLGAGAFPDDAQMIRSNDQAAEIAESDGGVIARFASRSELNAELLDGAAHRDADILFEDEYTLDLGGLEVNLYAMGPNHTRGDTAIWVGADQVLFSGDVAMSAQPAFASPQSSLSHWLSSLDRLEALGPAVVVPSHGPLGDVGFITGYRDYLIEVRDRTGRLKGEGADVEGAVSALTDELSDRYPSAGRLGGAVRAAYREAE